MKLLNPNKAQILLLFTRNPNIKFVNKELEYYISDDNKLIGFVSQDRIDETFHALLFDRDSQMKYCMVSSELDLDTIDEARAALNRQMSQYVRDEESLKRNKPCNDFFSIVTRTEQLHPFFRMLLEPEGFFTAARSVIEELSYHFEDRDGNFVDQFQSKNGFDARIWELYLWCYLREENFNFSYSYEAPDFLVNKMGQEVAIEAVHINRKKDEAEASRIPTEAEILEKLKNEIPLLFGSPLYSKLKHTYEPFDFYDLYRSTFENSCLGRIKQLLPLRAMAENFGLVSKRMRPKLGRKSFFTPEGKVALMFLEMYTDCVDETNAENGRDQSLPRSN